MKSLKVLTLCALMAVSGQSFAKTTTTEIKFTKGSHCGAYSGDIKNKKFDIYLQKNQTLQITVGSENVDDVIVRNPKGRPIKAEWVDDFFWLYHIPNGGKYTIYLKPHQQNYYTDFNVCAFFD